MWCSASAVFCGTLQCADRTLAWQCGRCAVKVCLQSLYYRFHISFICGYLIVASLIGTVTATYFPFFVGVEVARAVKEEGPASVDYASVNDSIMSGSPVVVCQQGRVPIAVN